jgi:hypothetical protein
MQEMGKIRELLGPAFGEGRYDEAAKIFADLVNHDTFVEFLTLPAHRRPCRGLVARADCVEDAPVFADVVAPPPHGDEQRLQPRVDSAQHRA